MNRLALFVSLLFYCQVAHAQNYQYHPQYAVDLGRAFNSFDPTSDLRSSECYEYTESLSSTTADETAVSKSETLEFSLVDSRSSLYRSVGISMEAEATLKFVNAESTSTFNEVKAINDRTLVYQLSTSVLYPEEALENQNLDLSNRGARAARRAARQNRKDPIAAARAFASECGTEVVSGIRRGSRVSVLYIFRTNHSSITQELRSELSVHVGKVSGTINFDQITQRVNENISKQVVAYVDGIESEDPQLVKLLQVEPGNITKIGKAIEAIANNFSPNAAPIRSFRTRPASSMEGYRDHIRQTEAHRLNRELLLEIFRESELVNEYIDDLELMQTVGNSNSFSRPNLERLESQIELYREYRALLLEEGRKCFNDGSECLRRANTLPKIYPSDFVDDFVNFVGHRTRVSQYKSNVVHWQGFFEVDLDMDFLLPSIVQRVDLIVDGELVSTYEPHLNDVSFQPLSRDSLTEAFLSVQPWPGEWCHEDKSGPCQTSAAVWARDHLQKFIDETTVTARVIATDGGCTTFDYSFAESKSSTPSPCYNARRRSRSASERFTVSRR